MTEAHLLPTDAQALADAVADGDVVARSPPPTRWASRSSEVGPGRATAAHDGARRHGQRPPHLPRRPDLHAGRYRLRLRLQQLQPQHRGLGLPHRLPGSGHGGRHARSGSRRALGRRAAPGSTTSRSASSAARPSPCSAARATASTARSSPVGHRLNGSPQPTHPEQRREETSMTVKKPLPGELDADRNRQPRRDLRPATRAPEVVGAPHLRQRRALPREVPCQGRAPGRPASAGRPGQVPVHDQAGPARPLPLRPVRRAAQQGGPPARLERHHRQAGRGGLHPERSRQLGQLGCPLDARGRPARRRHGA